MALLGFGKRNEEKEQEWRLKYAKGKTAQQRAKKFSKVSGSFFRGVQKQRRRQLIVAREIRRSPIGSGSRGKGKRGRPPGSVKYRHPVTGQPIGVYEYRKILSAQLRGQRLEQERNAMLTPQQQAYLQQLEQKKRMQQMSVESQPIPDTTGKTNLKSIHDEADYFANLVP